MLEVSYNGDNLVIADSNKKNIEFNTTTLEMKLDGFDVTHPGEYEKSEILLEVKKYEDKLFYHYLVDRKHLVFVAYDEFKLEEEILTFFGDVDILVIHGSKNAAKVFENIEAKMVIPYGDEKTNFLTAAGQHSEPVKSHKIKGDFALDATEFVNLEK